MSRTLYFYLMLRTDSFWAVIEGKRIRKNLKMVLASNINRKAKQIKNILIRFQMFWHPVYIPICSLNVHIGYVHMSVRI